jgi:hypothetical protein
LTSEKVKLNRIGLISNKILSSFLFLFFQILRYAIIDEKKAKQSKSQTHQLNNNNKDVLYKLRDSRLLSANTRGLILFYTYKSI